MRLFLLLMICCCLSACTVNAHEDAPPPAPSAVPAMPSAVSTDASGVPVLDVYVIEDNHLDRMTVEEYLLGVVAGEMKNDWPIEALRAQAILARTFVMRFVSEKDSRYPGADISTDITEAQAYDASAVNDAVREAVQSTAGMVLSTADGELPYAWFHAHSGGMTELAREGLNWNDPEPSWTKRTEGLDSPDAPKEAASWEAEFTAAELLAACRSLGVHPEAADDIRIVERSETGRAVRIAVAGEEVSAAELRIALGSTKMRSTLLTELATEDGVIRMAGRGYGHGVGMPQWGAYALAQDGFTGEEIAVWYFEGLHIARMWE